MKKNTICRLVSLFAVVLLLLSCGVVPTALDNPFSVDAAAESVAGSFEVTVDVQVCYDYALEVLDIVNETRAAGGLQPVKMDLSLTEVAMQRAADTVLYFDHVRPDGSDCFTVFPWSMMSGENIACGQRDPQEVMQSWINSPGHYQNIMTASFTSLGVGCVKAEDGNYYWVQAFNSNTATGTVKSGRKNQTFTVPVVMDYVQFAFNCPSSLNSGKTGKATVCSNLYNYFYTTLGGFSYSSSNPSVASVDANGNITALSAGSTTIKATAKGNSSVVFSQTLTVSGQGGHVHTMQLTKVEHSGQTFTVHQKCTTCNVTAQAGPYLNGDVDFSGDCSASDARTALRVSVQLESIEPQSAAFVACDVDCDGQITAGDARLILRTSVGLESIVIF